MPTWGKTDNTANSVLWAPQQLKKEANTSTRDELYGNTTADSFITGQTHGQYGVSDAEANAARAGNGTKAAHAGWVLRTEGSGNRAGRVHNEVLVALSSMTGDGTDDAAFPDIAIIISSQPVAATGNSSASDTETFAVVATTSPVGGSITYEWQYNADVANSAAWAAATGEDGISDPATATLSVNTAAVNSSVIPTSSGFRVVLQATGTANVTSSEAILTITT